MPKINNFKNDLLERDISVALISEIWEKKGNKNHRFEIEKMLQKDGLKYISTLRPPQKSGGGCAVAAYIPYYSFDKIDVLTQSLIEVTFGLL